MRKDIYMEVKMQEKQNIKVNCSDLSRKYGCDRRTVKRYQKENPNRKSTIRNSKLEPYKNTIRTKVEKYSATATAVFEFIKHKGYSGKYGIVKNFIRSEKLKGLKKATVRFETMPGEQAQVDWKERLTLINKNGKKFTINIFLYLMGSSRWKYIALAIDKKQDILLSNLSEAFKLSGGVPKEILFDNMKTVVDRTKTSPEGLKINDKMVQFAKDYNFKVKVCMPYRPQTKGKVEVVAKVTKRLLPFNEEFETLEDLSQIIKQLNIDLNQEICQATGKKPSDLLEKEKSFLSPLPATLILEYYQDLKIRRKVNKESMIQYKNKKYSVSPRYLGKEVEIVLNNENDIDVYYQGDKIRTHKMNNKQYNYNVSDLEEIFKTDVYKLKEQDFIEAQAKKHLEKLDLIYGGI